MTCFVLLIKVAHCGGISELRRLAALTETYDVALAPHCPLGPIAFAACMQVGTSSPNCKHSVITLLVVFLPARSRDPRNELAGETETASL